jgi:hypothetical protein
VYKYGLDWFVEAVCSNAFEQTSVHGLLVELRCKFIDRIREEHVGVDERRYCEEV